MLSHVRLVPLLRQVWCRARAALAGRRQVGCVRIAARLARQRHARALGAEEHVVHGAAVRADHDGGVEEERNHVVLTLESSRVEVDDRAGARVPGRKKRAIALASGK